MTSLLDETAARYRTLETRVQEAVAAICAPVCQACTERCCAARFCREAVDSPWLQLVATVVGNELGGYSAESGWLAAEGCRLKVGRPPVCYEFFCDAIMGHEESVLRRYALKVMGKLPAFVGRNALRGRHLVTLTASELRTRLNCNRLLQRLLLAEELFADCREILDSGQGRIDRLHPVVLFPAGIGTLPALEIRE